MFFFAEQLKAVLIGFSLIQWKRHQKALFKTEKGSSTCRNRFSSLWGNVSFKKMKWSTPASYMITLCCRYDQSIKTLDFIWWCISSLLKQYKRVLQNGLTHWLAEPRKVQYWGNCSRSVSLRSSKFGSRQKPTGKPFDRSALPSNENLHQISAISFWSVV